MKHASPSDLRTRIADVIAGSRLAERFKSLTLASGAYDDGGEFIRVRVGLSGLETISDDDIDALVASIEGLVERYDDRFPSVRFSEA